MVASKCHTRQLLVLTSGGDRDSTYKARGRVPAGVGIHVIMFVATVAAGKRAVRGWGDPPQNRIIHSFSGKELPLVQKRPVPSSWRTQLTGYSLSVGPSLSLGGLWGENSSSSTAAVSDPLGLAVLWSTQNRGAPPPCLRTVLWAGGHPTFSPPGLISQPLFRPGCTLELVLLDAPERPTLRPPSSPKAGITSDKSGPWTWSQTHLSSSPRR